MVQVNRIRFDDRADCDRWQAYIDARPDAHCSDLAEWRPLFRQLYGIADYSYLAVDQDRTLGALSLYHIRSPMMGKMLVTCPFYGYGGLYWESDAARDALMERARATARELRVDYVELRLTEELPAPFRSNTDFAEFNLQLDGTADEAWNSRLSSNVRQNIRKSGKQGLEFRLSTDYRPCFDLLRRTLRAHGTPFHGTRFFELLGEHLGDHVRYSEVRHGDRLVAGGIVIRFRHTIITPYIGSLATSRTLRSNYFQYWKLIEHCTEEGLTEFQMGRSPRDSTHARFKQKWGCEERPAFYNYLVVNPRKPYRAVSRPAPLHVLATRIWRRLPLSVTTLLGPKLFRYIP
jgi:FemAB-related protein (PEP-CTERM system-associated)